MMQMLLGSVEVFFAILCVMSLYGAYEFNRRLRLFEQEAHPQTLKLFNQLRFLFLLIGLHFALGALSGILTFRLPREDSLQPSIFCILAALTQILVYIGIGISVLRIALSSVLVLKKKNSITE